MSFFPAKRFIHCFDFGPNLKCAVSTRFEVQVSSPGLGLMSCSDRGLQGDENSGGEDVLYCPFVS